MLVGKPRGIGRVAVVSVTCALALVAPDEFASAESAVAEPTVTLVVSSASANARDLVDVAAGGATVESAHDIGQLDATVIEVPASQVAEVTARLEAEPAVESVQVDQRVHVAVAVAPDELTWSSHWGSQAAGMPGAWGRSTGSASTIVAVIDTGLTPFADLDGRIAPGGVNLVDPARSTDVTDDHGHGTEVSSIIAARGNNGGGIVGQCWECRILPIKALDSSGGGSLSDVAEGIVLATDLGASVINISAGGSSTMDVLDAAVAYASARGVVVVAAAGNNGSTESNYPAALAPVISVAASDASDALYSWSNRSASTVDVAAPGCDPAIDRAGATQWFCGTSAASPFVAGLVGLLRSRRPDLPAAQVRAALEATTAPLTSVGLVGHGRVNADAAMSAAVDSTPVPSPPPVDGAPAAALSVQTAGSGYLSGWVPASISASDDRALASVTLRVNGNVVASTGLSGRNAAVTLWWNSTGVADGAAVLDAFVSDSAGATGWAAPSSAVVDNGDPASYLWSPGTFSSVTGPIDVVASADDAVGVAMTIVIMNGAWVGAFAGGGFGVVRADPAPGLVEIVALTVDLSGRTSLSNRVVVDHRRPSPPAPARKSRRRRRRG